MVMKETNDGKGGPIGGSTLKGTAKRSKKTAIFAALGVFLIVIYIASQYQ